MRELEKDDHLDYRIDEGRGNTESQMPNNTSSIDYIASGVDHMLAPELNNGGLSVAADFWNPYSFTNDINYGSHLEHAETDHHPILNSLSVLNLGSANDVVGGHNNNPHQEPSLLNTYQYLHNTNNDFDKMLHFGVGDSPSRAVSMVDSTFHAVDRILNPNRETDYGGLLGTLPSQKNNASFQPQKRNKQTMLKKKTKTNKAVNEQSAQYDHMAERKRLVRLNVKDIKRDKDLGKNN